MPKNMEIQFTRKQYKELLLLVIIGSWVRGGVADMNGKYTPKMDELEDYLFEKAEDFDFGNLVENFEGHITPADVLDKECEKIIEEYNDDEFWGQLERRLGQRDFGRTMTEDEKQYIKDNNGWLPERIHEIYKKYEDEFEKYGIERLEIKE